MPNCFRTGFQEAPFPQGFIFLISNLVCPDWHTLRLLEEEYFWKINAPIFTFSLYFSVKVTRGANKYMKYFFLRDAEIDRWSNWEPNDPRWRGMLSPLFPLSVRTDLMSSKLTSNPPKRILLLVLANRRHVANKCMMPPLPPFSGSSICSC